MTDITDIDAHLKARFGEAGDAPGIDAPEVWATLATRGSVRSFSNKPIDATLVARLSALALCAPTKSDLQQRDIIHVKSPTFRNRIAALLVDQAWTQDIPELLIFCGNNQRQRMLHDMHARPFANDHLDAFFNAAVDAGIALSSFVIAAEAAGLGCCPISAIRNHAEEITNILELPQHVFPVAGLALGWPEEPATISPRLSLASTIHTNTYNAANSVEAIAEYDVRRNKTKPYATQRASKRFGDVENYGWSEDKARQYAEPERSDFGAYIRNQGFKLD